MRQKLETLLQELLAQNADKASTRSILEQYLQEGDALVAPVVTVNGGNLLIVTKANNRLALSLLSLPEFTTERVTKLLGGESVSAAKKGWFGAYNIQYLPLAEQVSRLSEWRDAIEGIGPVLWKLFAGQLDEKLQRLGVKSGARLVWMPAGALGLLPLHLANNPASGRRLGDIYEILVIANLEFFGASARQVAKAPSPSLAETVNPTGNDPNLDLPFTEIEGALVASHFVGRPQSRLGKADATAENVLVALKDKSYWHFSSHGFFDWSDTRKSGLLLKDKRPLSIGALLEAEGVLGHPRLVVLSACETGLFDIDQNPDEFVGLPSTFIQLGAAGVVGALWQVDDLATAFLMAKFYELHLDHHLEPALALKRAQTWLRTSSKAELIAYARKAAAMGVINSQMLANVERMILPVRRSSDHRSGVLWNLTQERGKFRSKAVTVRTFNRRNLTMHPFAHPYYWGGFVYTGL